MRSARSAAPPEGPPHRTLRAPIAVALVALAFVQLERGIGDPVRSLAYVAHDLAAWILLAVPLHLASRRPWTSAGASFAMLVVLHAASDAKVRAVLVPIEASDLGRLLDAWPVVASTATSLNSRRPARGSSPPSSSTTRTTSASAFFCRRPAASAR